ncbi:hypothetical protein [Actinoallomurus rhizosphaericola]|uniref:hypothetical protein n=1 Tax=Actinoallomurus rhizosphaericola TaxID=2952536 RepID=UPI0020915EF3|nr:hypothetical protein [Actinoallomurus rhizosphaericola]MCO5993307.1 hypothetical protein [Actinoallomurus rhizosphaericola]
MMMPNAARGGRAAGRSTGPGEGDAAARGPFVYDFLRLGIRGGDRADDGPHRRHSKEKR